MAKSFISKRVEFSKAGQQASFLLLAKETLGCNWRELSEMLGINQRTLRDWTKEKFRLTYDSLKLILKKSNLAYPESIKVVDLRDHLSKIARAGGISHIKSGRVIGGDKSYRIAKWVEWWKREGAFKISERPKSLIRIPVPDERLSEFVGIMIGDGGIGPYHISVTLHATDDLAYSRFVSRLIRSLFNVKPKIYFKKTSRALDIIVQRKKLVDYCLTLGLVKGNKVKQGIDIPQWIKNNKAYSIACVRGLFDTDGSVYWHKYFSGNKTYSYIKVSFSGESKPLIYSVRDILINLGFCARIGKRHNSVHLESQKDVRMFMSLIGSNNQKHLKMLRKSKAIWRRA